MSERVFRQPEDDLPVDCYVVSSARVERVGAHDRLRIWNRGALAGELVVNAGDGESIAARVFGLVEQLPEREGALYHRNLPDGRDITLYKHHAWQYALCVGKQSSGEIDQSFYYRSRDVALAAAKQWQGDGDAPIGWFRHPNSGRRREDGDPSTETYRP